MVQLKLRDQVNIEQEKLLGEKHREMEEVRRDLEQTKGSVRAKEDEVLCELSFSRSSKFILWMLCLGEEVERESADDTAEAGGEQATVEDQRERFALPSRFADF